MEVLCSNVKASGFGRRLFSHCVLSFTTVSGGLEAYPLAEHKWDFLPRKGVRTTCREVLKAESRVVMAEGHDDIGHIQAALEDASRRN